MPSISLSCCFPQNDLQGDPRTPVCHRHICEMSTKSPGGFTVPHHVYRCVKRVSLTSLVRRLCSSVGALRGALPPRHLATRGALGRHGGLAPRRNRFWPVPVNGVDDLPGLGRPAEAAMCRCSAAGVRRFWSGWHGGCLCVGLDLGSQ